MRISDALMGGFWIGATVLVAFVAAMVLGGV